MSGFAGIVNRSDTPVDQELIRKMTEFLVFRGPDSQGVWSEGQAALGHTLLRTTPESIDERQPCSLHGRVWIAADARLDARDDLRQRLAEKGYPLPAAMADARLILGAYHVWGEDCVQHLAGDFSFGIWDQDKRRLFCARDHFGCRPFFYAETGNSLVFGNTLVCLRLHPGIGRELDERFVGDWLIFERSGDPERTVFSKLQRLPAAHCLTWDTGGLHVRRFWSLPTEHPVIRFRHPRDYVEEFRRLMDLAIGDRLRTHRAAVFMSGGLDSTIVAAAAHAYLTREFGRSELQAHAIVYNRLVNDEERLWAPRAAAGIGIPLHVLPMDDYPPYPGWNEGEPFLPADDKRVVTRLGTQPEPVNFAIFQSAVDSHAEAADCAPVVLTGHGGDPALAWPTAYFLDLLRAGRLTQFLKEVASYWLEHGRRPPLGFRWLLGSWRKIPPPVHYPNWLNESFATRLDLPNRFQELNQAPPAAHKTRAKAYGHLANQVGWAALFESMDAGVTGVPLDVCHPLLDLRLIHFFLSIPPFPWCLEKEMLRAGAAGLLPEAVRLRPKRPFPADPSVLAFQQLDHARLARYTLPQELDPFIRRERVVPLADLRSERGIAQSMVDYRPYGFAYWIQQQIGSLTISKGCTT